MQPQRVPGVQTQHGPADGLGEPAHLACEFAIYIFEWLDQSGDLDLAPDTVSVEITAVLGDPNGIRGKRRSAILYLM
jgi:hypothetical protein